jgi:hypothetical protein
MSKVLTAKEKTFEERLQFDLMMLEKSDLLEWYRLALMAAERLAGAYYFTMSQNEKEQVLILQRLGILEPRPSIGTDGKPEPHVGKLTTNSQLKLVS